MEIKKSQAPAGAEFIESSKTYLNELSQKILNELKSDEQLKINYMGEDSLFIRFNEAKVRQNTTVTQDSISLELLSKNKSSQKEFSLSHNLDKDINTAIKLLALTRNEFLSMEEDPFLSPLESSEKSQEIYLGDDFDAQIGGVISESVKSQDFNGLWVSGPVVRASLNSLDANHFFAAQSFYMDYSIFKNQKSLKGIYADNKWNSNKWNDQLALAKDFTQQLSLPNQQIPKGKYRVYLAPQAVSEIMALINWGGFSQDVYRQGNSPFQKVLNKEATLSQLLHLEENFELGLCPKFNSYGESAPMRLNIIQNGEVKNLLTNKRSSKEYNLPSNQADSSEYLRSLTIHPGNLESKDILNSLHTGIYLSNLHYLNWSDRPNARMTGMTRYACFWVEDSKIKGPIQDLRFDESLLECFGKKLLAVTQNQEIIPQVGTYFNREIGGSKLPGMIVDDFTFTL